MKKAVLYARVSSLLQKERGTINSQIEALKKQISTDGNILVKEYVDDGYSGARLDRPALDELRTDLETDKFDSIYFWNTDRIARDVAYQTIIIAEILKYKKQIIINGKDYIHNPENKFALTVLGAVSELERAKIMERIMRGKKHKLRSGIALNNGMNIFGYDYIKKTDTESGKFIVNEIEAKTVRYVFDRYISGASWTKIIRELGEQKVCTKTGCPYWRIESLRNLLKQHTYTGIKYYNTRYHSKKHNDPIKKLKYGKKIYRDKSEWIPVKVPVIVSKKVFDQAQKRFEENRQKYRRPKETQLLSGFVECGKCRHSCTAYQRYVRVYYKYKGKLQSRSENVYHRTAYRCDLKNKNRVYAKNSGAPTCDVSEISAKRLEPTVFNMIEEYVTSPEKLKPFLKYSSSDIKKARDKIKTDVAKIDRAISQQKETKRDTLEQHSQGKIYRDEYSQLCLKADTEISQLESKKDKITKNIPTEIKEELVDESLNIYCGSARARLKHCASFDKKRKFLTDFISRIIYTNGSVTILGEINVQRDTRIRYKVCKTDEKF